MQVDIERYQEKLRHDLDALAEKVEHDRLKDEEINIIVEKVCDRLEQRVYHDIGQGVMGFVWKGIIIVLIGIAAYGAGVKHWFS